MKDQLDIPELFEIANEILSNEPDKLEIMKAKETEIIEATKLFATINNIHYDELTESMVLNALRELNKCFLARG